MSQSHYRDVLWDFTTKDSHGLVGVRGLANEEELFAHEWSDSADQGYECQLPLSELSATNRKFRERRWARERIEENVVASGGRALWNCLPTPLTSQLEEMLGDANSPVRLKISGNSTVINDLPWEWLRPTDDVALALRNDLRLCRSVPVLIRSPAMSVDLPIRVLVVLTNPKDQSLMMADEEIRAVTGELSSEKFKIEVMSEPMSPGFADQVLELRPNIIHYIGHAGISHGDGHLILRSSDGRTAWVSPPIISQILPGSVRLVCLSTCYTTLNYQLLGLLRLAFADAQLELPTVIANQYPLDGRSVASFWSTFYSSLIECGGDTCEAVHRARQTTFELHDSLGDWGSFAHILRDRTGHVFRFGHTRDIGWDANELKAYYATQLANDLAEKLRNIGTSATDGLESQVRAETERARGFLDELGDSDR